MKKIMALILLAILITSALPQSSEALLVLREQFEGPKSREIEVSDNTTANNSFARGGSRNIVRGIDNIFYYFWHNTTDVWCSVVTKNGPDLSAGAPFKLVGGTGGIIQNMGINTEVQGLSVDINRSRTEIYIIWSFYSTIAGTSALLFSKCTDLTNIDQTASWKAINDAVGYDSIITSSGYIYQGLSIALNRSSIPHIVWHEYNGINTINYTTVKSNAWQAPIRIAQNNSDFARLWNPIIDINRTNVAHIFWGNTSRATDIGWVNHTYCDTTANDPMVLTNWNLEAGPILENINTTGYSQAIDRNNDIWLAGVNETNDLQLNVLNGSTWLNGTGENISFPHAVENISLGADANGTIYLGYTDETNDDIRYATSKNWFSTNTKIADYGTYAGITIEKRSKYDQWSLGLGWVNGSNFEEVHFENLTVVYNDVWWKYSPYNSQIEGYDGGYDIAVNGKYTHLVWTDRRNEVMGTYVNVYYRRSEDYGVTWSGDCLLSDGITDNIDAISPSIALNGTNLHVVYNNSAIGGNDLIYLNSTDNGKTWSGKKEFANWGSSHPDIAVYNDHIHIVYLQGYYKKIYYLNSSDGGISFVTPKVIMEYYHAGDESYEPVIAASEHYIGVGSGYIWTEFAPNDIYYYRFTNSSDNGTTWTDVQNISLPYTDIPTNIKGDIEINNSNIYVAHTHESNNYYDEIVLNVSTDLGQTWLSQSVVIANESGVSGCYAPNIMVNSTSIDIVYYTTNATNRTIKYNSSSDGGNTWLSQSETLLQDNGSWYPMLYFAKSMDNNTRNIFYMDCNALSSPTTVILKSLRGWSNNPPQFIDTPSDPDYAYVDELYSFDVNATDPDSDPIIYDINTNSSFLSINSNSGVLNGTPTNTDVGTYFVNISANDTFTEVYYNFTLTVKAGSLNISNALSNFSWYDDMWRQHWYQASNISGNYNWTLVTNATQTNCSSSINSQTGYMRLIPNGPGESWWFNITITDESESDWNNFTLTCLMSPPYPGDWWVYDNQTKTNETLPLRGNLTILEGKTLTLENITLEINCTVDAEFHIWVWGHLAMNNTTITINYTTYFYNFTIFANGSAMITNSTIEFVYNGIHILSSNVLIDNSTIRFNYGDGLLIENSAPTITYNEIYSHTENGITVENGTPIIHYNTIQHNEWSGIAINYSTVTVIHNTIYHNKVGIYIYNSTVVSDSNTIRKSKSIGVSIEINSTYTSLQDAYLNNLVQLTLHNLSTSILDGSSFSSDLIVTQPDFDFLIEGNMDMINCSVTTIKNTIFSCYNATATTINSSLTSGNINSDILEGNTSLTFLNTSLFDNHEFNDDSNSTATVMYYLHVYVLDNHGGVDNATVNITDANGVTILNQTTDSTGWIKNIVLIEYVTNATTKIMFTPHIIVVRNGTKVQNRSLTMDKTRTLIIDFSNTLVFNLVQNQWNLIGISKDLSTTYTAGDLVALGCSKVIYRDTSGAYKSYIYEGGKYYGSDFTIYSYKSYFVYYTKSTSMRLSGTERSGAVTLALVKGYNMVAVPHSGISTLDIIQDVEGAKNVLVRRSGQYKSFSISSSPNSAFFLNENEGVYIYVDKSTSWTIK